MEENYAVCDDVLGDVRISDEVVANSVRSHLQHRRSRARQINVHVGISRELPAPVQARDALIIAVEVNRVCSAMIICSIFTHANRSPLRQHVCPVALDGTLVGAQQPPVVRRRGDVDRTAVVDIKVTGNIDAGSLDPFVGPGDAETDRLACFVRNAAREVDLAVEIYL